MLKVEDSSFGEMEYKHGWIKKQKVMLWECMREIKIKASAYKGEEILSSQQENYNHFSENIDYISTQSFELVKRYLEKNYKSVNCENVKELVIPRSVLFKRDGSYGILCDFELDEEHGLVIGILPKEVVDIQDTFL